MSHYLDYLTLAIYAASFVCYARVLYAPDIWVGRLASALLAGGIALHYFALLERSRLTHTVPYDDLYGSMSLFAASAEVSWCVRDLAADRMARLPPIRDPR
jgi:hypothetical protein